MAMTDALGPDPNFGRRQGSRFGGFGGFGGFSGFGGFGGFAGFGGGSNNQRNSNPTPNSNPASTPHLNVAGNSSVAFGRRESQASIAGRESLNGRESQSGAPPSASGLTRSNSNLSTFSLQSNMQSAIRCKMAAVTRQGQGGPPGYKVANQDSCFAFETYLHKGQYLWGVMDGHGVEGHIVSRTIRQHLPEILMTKLEAGMKPMPALQATFADVDNVVARSFADVENSGSTGVIALMQGRTMTTAWVGDSRCVLGRQQGPGMWEAVPLTDDHKPDRPDEQKRIEAAGGRVARVTGPGGSNSSAPVRVWFQDMDYPGLAMSRAFGDLPSRQIGVTAEPEMRTYEVTEKDKVMILASDGVWEFVENSEAVELAGNHGSALESCRALVDESYKRWMRAYGGAYVDDITAVVVKFEHA